VGHRAFAGGATASERRLALQRTQILEPLSRPTFHALWELVVNSNANPARGVEAVLTIVDDLAA
jgi:hypothetical protein